MDIILADDHDLVRDALETYLMDLAAGVRVRQAGSLAEALRLVEESQDLRLILLDLLMPGMNGLNGLAVTRRRCPEVPVVMLSGQADSETIKGALRAGAAGFIPKAMRGEAMLNALRLVLSGEHYVPQLVVDPEGANEAKTASASKVLDTLTLRERDVMSHLVMGMPNREIGNLLNISDVTVGLHLRSIYRKLSVANRTQAVRLALENGWQG